MDEELNTLLSQHRIPESEGLAQRIVSAARSREDRPTLWQALGDLLKPVPVAALACSLMLGMIASRHLPYTEAPMSAPRIPPKISHNAGAFLYYNGEVL